MPNKTSEETFIQYKADDVVWAAQSLIAASSIIMAVSNEYAHAGSISIGALIHAGNVVDGVIERLDLAEVEGQQRSLPF